VRVGGPPPVVGVDRLERAVGEAPSIGIPGVVDLVCIACRSAERERDDWTGIPGVDPPASYRKEDEDIGAVDQSICGVGAERARADRCVWPGPGRGGDRVREQKRQVTI
jgi:hypothetical protein